MHTTIFSLIFKSTEFAESTVRSLYENTPELLNGEANFFFVANNATEEVIDFLEQKKYPYIRCDTKPLNGEQLNTLGYTDLFYMHTIWKAHNVGIRHSPTDRICMISSDMRFSPGWLAGLLKYSTPNRYVTSRLIEPIRGIDIFTNFLTGDKVVQGNFGTTLDSFNEIEFLKAALALKTEGYKPLISYVPSVFYRSTMLKIGLFPEGHLIHSPGLDVVPMWTYKGDEIEYADMVAIRRLQNIGVECITSHDSIVYHFDQGEKCGKT